jgi:hypothetical protein
MKIGHICLAPPDSDAGGSFATLVEAIASLEVEQHVLVASVALARRLAVLPLVTVGPVVTTPVMAYCLMPNVDIAHVHEGKSGQAGLLLTLTRSIPFVITVEENVVDDKNPMTQSVLHRAARTMPFQQEIGADGLEAAARTHLNVYKDALSVRAR